MFLAAGNLLRFGGHDRIADLDRVVQRLPVTAGAFALGGWKYYIDLLRPETFSEIRILFAADAAPKHYVVRAKTDDATWQLLLEETDADSSAVTVKFEPITSRFVEIECIDTSDAAIASVEIY